MSGRNKHFRKKNFRSDSENALNTKKKLESQFSSEINVSIRAYNTAWKAFDREYKQWNPTRQWSISELRKLAKEVNEDQLAFNNRKLIFKQVNVETRKMRNNDNSRLDAFASVASLVTDIIDGVNSIAQACNVDSYMEKFGDIMEKDAKVTKRLYEARSNCFTEYRAVEEIIRKYHSDTFKDTMNKVTTTLRTEDMWLELKNSRSGNDISKIAETIEMFLGQLSRVEVLNDVRKSVLCYVDSNPAVLDACESTAKALYGIYDTWGYDKEKENSVTSRNISRVANNAIISREQREIDRLREQISDESEPQAKIERKVQEALFDFEKEEREVRLLFESSSSFISRTESRNSSYDYAGARYLPEEFYGDSDGASYAPHFD